MVGVVKLGCRWGMVVMEGYRGRWFFFMFILGWVFSVVGF